MNATQPASSAEEMTSGSSSGSSGFEDAIARYEYAQQHGGGLSIETLLREVDNATTRFHLLIELVQVDLEWAWRAALQQQRSGPLLERYVKQFTALDSLDALPVALVAGEYRVRQLWGDNPTHAAYTARFPRHGAALTAALNAVDEELRSEGGSQVELPAIPAMTDSDINASLASQPRENASRRIAAPGNAPDPRAPASYADFHLLRQIGSGGVSRVYTAVQRSLQKPVAVKILKKQLLENPRAIDRFLNEARTAASLKHPGVVDVHSLGRLPGGGYFMVMDLIRGNDLAHLCQVAPLPSARVVCIARALAGVLAHVHARGVVHCDVKPGNVLQNTSGDIWLTDFGFARPIDAPPPRYIAGTAAYMAPEQFLQTGDAIGPQTDIYGLGATLFTLLTGQPPDVSSGSDINASLLFPPGDSVSAALQQFIVRCLQPAARDRFASIAALLGALPGS